MDALAPLLSAEWIRGDDGILWECDFTKLTSQIAQGYVDAAPGAMQSSRGSTATVQTGTSTVVTGIAVDKLRLGRKVDSDPPMGVLEESRTNDLLWSRDVTRAAGWAGAASSCTQAASAVPGPDGSVAGTRLTTTATNGYSRYAATAAGRIASEWYRNVAGSLPAQAQLTSALTIAPASASWGRVVGSYSASSSGSGHTPLYSASSAGGDGLVRDVYVDLAQVENGKFATEAISTAGAPATRSGDRWCHYAAALVQNGRIGLHVRLRPKGAVADYSDTPYVFGANAGADYARFDPTNGKVSVVTAGGAAYTATTRISPAADAASDLWIEAGGNVLQTVIAARATGTGAWSELGRSSSPQGTIALGGLLDLLCNGTASQYTSRVEFLRAYRPGRRPF